MQDLLSSLRVVAASIAICVAGYVALVLGFAQLVMPGTANGSLIVSQDGTIIGSRQVAQAFTRPEYLWPRPSAVNFNAAGAGGSNLSPAGVAMAEHGAEAVARYGADASNPLPADLASASGAGLDPHISLAGALYQVPRVAEARGLDPTVVARLIEDRALRPGGPLTRDAIVNVLETNLALDALSGQTGA